MWRAAIEMSVYVYTLTAKKEFRSKASLRNQIERATISISNNIAEGFERRATQELLTFIHAARGSAGELRSMLCLLERFPEFSNLNSQISDLKSLAEGISGQLRAWADSLQNPSIKGQRYPTGKARHPSCASRERVEVLQVLRRIQEEDIARSRSFSRRNE